MHGRRYILHGGHQARHRDRLVPRIPARSRVQHRVDELDPKRQRVRRLVPDIQHEVEEQVRAAVGPKRRGDRRSGSRQGPHGEAYRRDVLEKHDGPEQEPRLPRGEEVDRAPPRVVEQEVQGLLCARSAGELRQKPAAGDQRAPTGIYAGCCGSHEETEAAAREGVNALHPGLEVGKLTI